MARTTSIAPLVQTPDMARDYEARVQQGMLDDCRIRRAELEELVEELQGKLGSRDNRIAELEAQLGQRTRDVTILKARLKGAQD